jgi:long-chain acyl-CoA synthetase
MAVGPPLDDDVAEFLCGWGVAVAEGLAADEIAGPMTFSADGIVRLGTSGRPVEGLEIESGPDGYLRVRGPTVASEASPRGGPGAWLRIGLRGATDEEGRVRLG